MTQAMQVPELIGRSVRWHGDVLHCPPSTARAGAEVEHDEVEVSPGVFEVAHGVPVRPGDPGVITGYQGVSEAGHCYVITFANGAVLPLILPSNVVEIAT